MRRFVWLLVCGLVLSPVAASAHELVFGADALTTYDDNIFNRTHKEENDVSFLFGPYLEFRSDPGNLSYSVSYNPMYEVFVDTNGIDGWRHRAQGRLDYRPNARTAFYASESFVIAPYILEGFDASSDGMLVNNAAVDATREDVKRNYFDVGVEHFLTPRTRLNVDFRTGLLDGQSGSDRIADQQSYVIGASLTRAMTKRDKLSIGVDIGHQEYEGIREQRDSDEQTYYLYGGWEHQWSRDLALSFRAGPAFIKNDSRPNNDISTYQITMDDDGNFDVLTTTGCVNMARGTAGCQTTQVAKGDPNYGAVRAALNNRTSASGAYGRPSEDDTTLSVFAEIEFIKRWDRSSLGFHYLRSTSAQHLVGFESSTIQDMIELQGRHQFTKRLNGVLTLTWNRYESSTDITRPGAVGAVGTIGTLGNVFTATDVFYVEDNQRIDIQTYRAAFSLRYQLDRRSTLSFGSSYLYRTSDSSWEASRRDNQLRNDIFRVWVGYTFRFEPIDI